MNYARDWYSTLRKPSFAPPAWIFAPVWIVLYVLIAISFGFVAYQAYQGVVPSFVLIPFICNIMVNLAYSPIQFRLRNLVLASLDVVLVLYTLVVALALIHPYFPWVVWVNIPYLLWVSFATVLQLSIMYLNRKREEA